MEEAKEKDVSGNGVVGSSALVTSSEEIVIPAGGGGGGGEVKLAVRNVNGEDQGLNEASLKKDVEDGGHCNGVDRVVGIIGSEVARDRGCGLVDVGGNNGVAGDLGSRKNWDSSIEELGDVVDAAGQPFAAGIDVVGENVSREGLIMKEAEAAVEESVKGVAMSGKEVQVSENETLDRTESVGLVDKSNTINKAIEKNALEDGITVPASSAFEGRVVSEDMEEIDHPDTVDLQASHQPSQITDGEQGDERDGLCDAQQEMEVEEQNSDGEEMKITEEKRD